MVSNFIRSYLLKITHKTSLISWATSFGLINSICLFMISYSFYDLFHNKIIYFLITKISNLTFYVYLIHIFVINNIFKEYRIDKKINKNTEIIKGIIIYYIKGISFVFISSLLISYLISIILNLIYNSKKILDEKIKNK